MVEGLPIGDKGSISPTKAIPQEGVSSQDQPDQSFKNLVNQTTQTNTSKPSPMNVAATNPGVQPTQANPQNLLANMQLVFGQMKNLGAALQTPGLKLNPRTSRLVDAKLKRAKDHINYVSSKVNVGDEGEQQKPKEDPKKSIGSVDEVPSKKGAQDATVSKFIGYVTDGQSQLESAMSNVSKMKMDKNNPGIVLQNIFGMQVKLYRAQVEIEFSSAVIQKAIDDLKTIMSVQL